ncbi:MAG TPA: N(4)-(beta-N-acetylglucosaminyl)-L-asparaginase [Lacibacter sp.]|nr:N(4)-(beta-N-acetylglucosaminyl)-L-asparaginase [Lacibacter sp.]HMO89670.1 N(4)-(beta-N-acetylglucosaminyl)-L-asparaginase [Lacibacter sp.]HMP86487.1 N(4)-(beta-N-acetylglucosaminyl)-L-asparaginase [Lacibacter sp.]
MLNRRDFLHLSGLATLLPALGFRKAPLSAGGPLVISTWAPNVKANRAAWTILEKGGRALDAVEAGVMIPEADPTDNSVGYGGLPDRDGRVTLDACVMDEQGNTGAVMCLEHILHPVQVARLVMEQTPHVQLVGEGALRFALSKGFRKQNLLTPASERAWKEWLRQANYDPNRSVRELEQKIKSEQKQSPHGPHLPLNHDTIGMLALDSGGRLSGACSTSGMAFKMKGRVGDSPIIGAGLFVDNEVGAATATGVGEELVKICGAHAVVENMRHGASPEEACAEVIRRMVRKQGNRLREMQVGLIAVNKEGVYGGYALQRNFSFAVKTMEREEAVETKSYFS